MKTIQYILISFVVITVSLLYLSIKNMGEDTADQGSNIIIKTTVIGNGFGYEILENGYIIIKQEYIPVIKGKQSFCSEKDARTIAEIIKNKIENKESPSISYVELIKSKISLNCPQIFKNDIVP